VLVASTAGACASSLLVTRVGGNEQAKETSGSRPPAPQGSGGFTVNVAALVGAMEWFRASLQDPG